MSFIRLLGLLFLVASIELCNADGRLEQMLFLTEQSQKDFVSFHNLFRQQIKPFGSNIECVKGTNSILVNIAQNYANRCTIKSATRKDLLSSCYEKPGIVISYDTVFKETAEVLFDLFVSNAAYYNFDENSCEEDGVNECNNFRQVVWHRMNEIGCGRAQCAEIEGLNQTTAGFITVCAYSEIANASMQPYAIGQRCSECPSMKNTCTENLCCGYQLQCNLTVDDNTSSTVIPTSITSAITKKPNLICPDNKSCSQNPLSLCYCEEGVFQKMCRINCPNCNGKTCCISCLQRKMIKTNRRKL